VTAATVVRRPTRRALAASGAFIRHGAVTISAYPLSFAVTQLGALVPIFVYAYLGKLVTGATTGLGGDWFSFVVVGVVVGRVLSAGVAGLGEEMDDAIKEGRLEILLTTPVSARSLPLLMAEWPIVTGAATSLLLLAVGIGFGADLRAGGALLAFVFIALGTVAAHGIGLMAVSVQMLVKRSGPIQQLHGMAVATIAGAYFPTALLPGPLHALSWLLPETWVFIGVRRAVLLDGSAVAGPSTWIVLAVVALFAAVLFPLGVWLYGRALRTARASGLLAGY
jgi:ABC-type multidrug transport system permease subunit